MRKLMAKFGVITGLALMPLWAADDLVSSPTTSSPTTAADRTVTKAASGATSAKPAVRKSTADANPSLVNKSPSAKAPAAGKILVTPEREAAARMFVKQNHPELAELLISLKESSPHEYERAIRDLYRTSERLAQVQERDPLGYELELAGWQAKSRAQLLVARLHMHDTPELRGQLRKAVEDGHDLRLQLLRHERQKIAERVENLDGQIDRLDRRRDELIETQFHQMTKTLVSKDRKSDKPKSTTKRKPNTATSPNK